MYAKPDENPLVHQGTIKLLALKDTDMRLDTLLQGQTAIDRGLHAGGAFSGIVPMVALFYGGFFHTDIKNPTSSDSDIFVLSKGHGIAGMASVYADFGYFNRSLLQGSRSYESMLHGHPGPILPGVHLATGPLGQGLAVATGYAIANRFGSCADTYCLVGDAELHEGTVWETIQYAGARNLRRLCIIVDRNNGSHDDTSQMLLPLGDIGAKFEAFGFKVFDLDGTGYEEITEALKYYKTGQNRKPVAIISNCEKGEGGLSLTIRGHKITVTEELALQEGAMQNAVRKSREQEFCCIYNRSKDVNTKTELRKIAQHMNFIIMLDAEQNAISIERKDPVEYTRRAPTRDKKLKYDREKLRNIVETGKEYACDQIITAVISELGKDTRTVTVDADCGLITGLSAGMNKIDHRRALNVGIAEANMMGISEAFASLGYSAWCGTFGVFINWNVMRRIATGYQERSESIAGKDGWLSEGHNLDISFIATAANLDAQTNGATHMSIDDIDVFYAVPHLKIIDISCPRQLIGVMEWIAEGNKGLVYLRIMRAKARVLYDDDYSFEYGRANVLQSGTQATLISSGRQVHESLAASKILAQKGVSVGVIDMPSPDYNLFAELAQKNETIFFAEQNDAFLYKRYLEGTQRQGICINPERTFSVSTLDEYGKKRFLHSGTYQQLINALGLDGESLAAYILSKLQA